MQFQITFPEITLWLSSHFAHDFGSWKKKVSKWLQSDHIQSTACFHFTHFLSLILSRTEKSEKIHHLKQKKRQTMRLFSLFYSTYRWSRRKMLQSRWQPPLENKNKRKKKLCLLSEALVAHKAHTTDIQKTHHSHILQHHCLYIIRNHTERMNVTVIFHTVTKRALSNSGSWGFLWPC